MTRRVAGDFKKAIENSGKTIYSQIEVGDPVYWIPTPELESLLHSGLKGLKLTGLPLRTRSKIVKQAVCRALGYPVPSSFAKTQPRFPAQQFDTYVQKALNLQIWNEELSPTRRYVLIRVSSDDVVTTVKVINGQMLALLDTTGTITRKYQARLDVGNAKRELISSVDTEPLRGHLGITHRFAADISPTNEPESGSLLPIRAIFERLSPLVGKSFRDPGVDQERNRGAALHELVCKALGYERYEDTGQFPDVRHQLLEVKLQTSPTIDLGLVLPSSPDHVEVTELLNYHPQHRDTRYALFYATLNGGKVSLENLFITTGADFFTRFRRFEGKVINGKIQIPLPGSLFD